MPTKLSALHPIFRPIFSGVLPHRLKNPFLGLPRLQHRVLLVRGQAPSLVPFVASSYSTRSGRERMGSGFKQNASAGSSKSLIDDEADLSDWVSGLNSSSIMKTKVYSDSDDEESEKSGVRDGTVKRRRDGAFGRDSDFSGGRRGGNFRSSEPFSRRRNENNGSNGGSFGGRGRDRGRDSGDFRRKESSGSGGGLFGGRGKGRDSGEFRRNERFKEKRESGGDFVNRGNERWREKGKNERTFDVGYKRGDDKSGFGVTRRGKETGRREFLGTDDEYVGDKDEGKDKGYMSFKKLIDSGEDDDDDDDDDEQEVEAEEEDVIGDGVVEKGKSFSQLAQSSIPVSSDSHLSESRFDQCPISPLSFKAIKDAGYERMTLVQEATLPVILKGKDVLAKAKTGTGKTVAFLLPAIELVVKSSPVGLDQKRPPILVLVICPTRELASQAATEANTLLKYHPSIGVQVVIGGTRLALEQKRMQANPCQILVATPGRLRDHIENTSGFATRLMGVKVLVLDEADHLLDMGFRKEIERIIAAVPKQRQTLLFSATVPQEVRQICHIALKRDHEFINTVQEGSEDTHAQVRQTHLVAPLDKHFPLLYTLLKEHIADDVNYKILVFCTTAMVTRLVADLLGELNLNVREIHSRKPQSYRTRISDEFRKSKGLILVTSDVSARGVDYPDVTLVVQIGVPADRQQYIHRLGRTGRKGKEGQGILMLAPWEEFFLSSIKDLPLSKAPEPLVDPDTRKKVERALSHVEMKNKEAAYQAWLGYYNSNRNIGRDKYRLVELANEFSRCMGLDNPPAIPKLVLGKMGLKNIPGLRSK
ncbi:DEAD-box ATP-dependent RNA helicase 26 [Striga hermonthica]|uniref:ATP-dependent RNA helicase n=1 Tax=Striga hermonthica TaxID=68872 RepID=A0A9N7MXV4_STRHE|nr:DEAD-box ATP-dependent RNA helicase 26 [Striga hermonthica]